MLLEMTDIPQILINTITNNNNNSVDFLCEVRLNQSICHLGCGLRWAEKSIISIVFARWHQCAPMEGYIGAT